MNIRPPTDSRFGAGTATHSLFDALQKHVLDRVTPALDAALGDADDYLFDLSQKGDEDLGLGALREMRRARAQIVQGFRSQVTARFTVLATCRAMTGEALPATTAIRLLAISNAGPCVRSTAAASCSTASCCSRS